MSKCMTTPQTCPEPPCRHRPQHLLDHSPRMTTPQTLGELEAWLEAEAEDFEKQRQWGHADALGYAAQALRTVLHGTICEDCGGSGDVDGSDSVFPRGEMDILRKPCPSCNNGRVGGLVERVTEHADYRYDDLKRALTIELNPKEEG